MKQSSYILILLALLFAAVTYRIIKIKKKLQKTEFGNVIILNGPSSVGKTSIIKAFQAKQKKPWLSIGIDNFFVGILPKKVYLEDKPEHHSVMRGISSEDKGGNKVYTLKVGAEGQKVIKGMHRAIAAYAKTGSNVIVDYINYDPSWIADLKKSLLGIKKFFVRVTASLETIEKRERSRGTSPEGHARSHYDTVDKGLTYNLTINTESTKPEQAAQKIIDHFSL